MLSAETESELVRLGARSGRMLVAVSGGRDSMVLLDLMDRARAALELELVVGHIDHGLRGEVSSLDAGFVRAEADLRGLRSVVRAVSPEAERVGGTSRSRPTLEEAARNLRRAALEAIALEADCDWIATAHHAGDQAETVLLRLFRGTSIDGLAGISPRSADGRWLRPLLAALPDEIGAWASERGIRWREDASNLDRRFTRNRLRHDWLPGLAKTFNPQLLRTVAHLAEAGRTDLEWIEGIVDEAEEGRIERAPDGIRFKIDGWAVLPDALARRLIRRALVESGLGRDITRAHLLRVLAFLRRGRGQGRDKQLELPRGVRLRREDEFFLLSGDPPGDEIGSDENATVHRRD